MIFKLKGMARWEVVKVMLSGLGLGAGLGFMGGQWFNEHVQITKSSNGKVEKYQIEVEIPSSTPQSEREKLLAPKSFNFVQNLPIMRNFDDFGETVFVDAAASSGAERMAAEVTASAEAKIDSQSRNLEMKKSVNNATTQTASAIVGGRSESVSGGGIRRGEGVNGEKNGRLEANSEEVEGSAKGYRYFTGKAREANQVKEGLELVEGSVKGYRYFTGKAREANQAKEGLEEGVEVREAVIADDDPLIEVGGEADFGEREVWVDVEDIPRRVHLEQMIITKALRSKRSIPTKDKRLSEKTRA